MKEICEYLVDSFIDYAGDKHYVIICSVSSVSTYGIFSGYRMVSLGIAICNPQDVFNIEVGQKIAYNKAMDPVLFTNKPGTITSTLINSLLTKEMEFVKNNPGKIIAGYDKAKFTYLQKLIDEKELLDINNDEGLVIQAIIDGVDLYKCERLAKVQIKKLNELAKTM